jgi:sec-independent protein translocase protein TatA
MRIGPFGPWEIFVILVVVLLFFGPKRLPEMAKGIGQSVREFRRGIRGVASEAESAATEAAAAEPSAAQHAGGSRAPEPVDRG